MCLYDILFCFCCPDKDLKSHLYGNKPSSEVIFCSGVTSGGLQQTPLQLNGILGSGPAELQLSLLKNKTHYYSNHHNVVAF